MREEFPLNECIAGEAALPLDEAFGISKTFLVDETRMNMSAYEPQRNYHHRESSDASRPLHHCHSAPVLPLCHLPHVPSFKVPA